MIHVDLLPILAQGPRELFQKLGIAMVGISGHRAAHRDILPIGEHADAGQGQRIVGVVFEVLVGRA